MCQHGAKCKTKASKKYRNTHFAIKQAKKIGIGIASNKISNQNNSAFKIASKTETASIHAIAQISLMQHRKQTWPRDANKWKSLEISPVFLKKKVITNQNQSKCCSYRFHYYTCPNPTVEFIK